MLQQLLNRLWLGEVFGQSVQPEPTVERDPRIGRMAAAYLQEIKGEQGPLLYVTSTKSAGVLVTQPDFPTLTAEDGTVVIDGTDVSSYVPENMIQRKIQLNDFETADEIQQAVQE